MYIYYIYLENSKLISIKWMILDETTEQARGREDAVERAGDYVLLIREAVVFGGGEGGSCRFMGLWSSVAGGPARTTATCATCPINGTAAKLLLACRFPAGDQTVFGRLSEKLDRNLIAIAIAIAIAAAK